MEYDAKSSFSASTTTASSTRVTVEKSIRPGTPSSLDADVAANRRSHSPRRAPKRGASQPGPDNTAVTRTWPSCTADRADLAVVTASPRYFPKVRAAPTGWATHAAIEAQVTSNAVAANTRHAP